jgi:hypothetical protein
MSGLPTPVTLIETVVVSVLGLAAVGYIIYMRGRER